MTGTPLKLYFCTLDTSVAYYLVAAEFASDCFDVIDRTEHLRAIGAYPSALNVEFADARHLTEHDVRTRAGIPIFVSIINHVPSDQVIWSSEWR